MNVHTSTLCIFTHDLTSCSVTSPNNYFKWPPLHFWSQLTSPSPFSSWSIIFSWTPLRGLPQLPTLHPSWLWRRFSVWHPEHSLIPYISMRGILMDMKYSWTSLRVGATPTPNILHCWNPKALRNFLNTSCFATAHPQGRDWLQKVSIVKDNWVTKVRALTTSKYYRAP